MSEVIAEWGPRGYPTRVTLAVYRGRRLIDIRKYYGDAPTKKGLSLGTDQFTSMMSLLAEEWTRIQGWFAEEDDDTVRRLEEVGQAVRRARTRELSSPVAVETRTTVGGASELFSMEFQGGRVVVHLNDRHSLVEALGTAVERGDLDMARRVLAVALQGSFHAAALEAGNGESVDLDAAERHAHFLGLSLHRAARDEFVR